MRATDDSLFEQYFKYIGKLLTGDFGETFNEIPVGDLIGDAYPVTLRLALVAICIEALIGVGAGVLTGLRGRGRPRCQ